MTKIILVLDYVCISVFMPSNYTEEQTLKIKNLVDDYFIKNGGKKERRLNSDTLTKLVDFINQAINVGDEGGTRKYICSLNYKVDFEDLAANADKLFERQNNIDLLLELLSVQNIPVVSQKPAGELFLKLFKSVKSDGEKYQIASIVSDKLNHNPDIAKAMINYYDIPPENLNLNNKRKNVWLKTNGFFEAEPGVSDKIRRKELLNINDVINKALGKIESDVSHNKDVTANAKDLIGQTIDDLKNNIYGLFTITDENLSEEDYVRNAQVKKIQIYLLLKTVNSNKWKNKLLSSCTKKEVTKNIGEITGTIDKILKISSDGKNKSSDLFETFARECDFTLASMPLFADYDYSVDGDTIGVEDILACYGEENSEIETKSIDSVLDSVSNYDGFEFFEIPDSSEETDEFVCTKTITKNNKNKLLICYRKSQKKMLFSAMYRNKFICNKIANASREEQEENKTKPELNDFAKIIDEVSNDPVPTENYLDVYNKYYLHCEDGGLGGVKNDQTFSTQETSIDNFIRNDYSKYTITTDVLFNWLKLQAISGNPLRDMTVSICDLENLPKMLREYKNFINKERNDGNRKNLTPVTNLIIRNINSIPDKKIMKFCADLNSAPICFYSLSINDSKLAQYDDEYNLMEDNSYIFFGNNGNFYSKQNLEKINNRDKSQVLSSDNKIRSVNFVKISEGQHKLPNYDIKIKEKENIKLLEKRIEQNTAGGNNEDADVDVDVAVDTDVDVNVENILDFKKQPPTLDNLSDEDCITRDNIVEKMKELLAPNNTRFTPEQKRFLSQQIKNLGDSQVLIQLFDLMTNRLDLQNKVDGLDLKYVNDRFTPEAFLHIFYDYIKFGFVRWNGIYGDPELCIYSIKDNKGKTVYAVAKTTENTKTKRISPVHEMFQSIPIDSIETDDKLLNLKYNFGKIEQDLQEISDKLNDSDSQFIKAVFVDNPSKLPREYANYISEHKDELIGFVDFISKNPAYKIICNRVCSKFCIPISVGNIKMNFSVINPLSFSNGMIEIFRLLDELKNQHFINDDLIRDIILASDIDNKYAIQNIYQLLLQHKIKVEKAIAEYRGLNEQNVGIDVNDIVELTKYFKKNPIKAGTDEEKFSHCDFCSIFNTVKGAGKKDKLGNELLVLDDCYDSLGTVTDPMISSKTVSNFIFSGKDLSEIKYTPRDKENDYHVFCADLSELLYMMSKKYNRETDGTVNDLGLNGIKRKIVQNKVPLCIKIDELIKKNRNNEIKDDICKQKAYILVYVLKQMIETQTMDIEIQKLIESVDGLSEENTKECYELVKNDKKMALLYLNFYKNNNKENELLKLYKDIEEGKIKIEDFKFSDVDVMRKYFAKVYIFAKKLDDYDARIAALKSSNPDKSPLLDNDLQESAFFENGKNDSSYDSDTVLLNAISAGEKAGIIGSSELLRHAKNILTPDILFKSLYGDCYDKEDDKHYNKKLFEEFEDYIVKYCFAENNYGRFSVLSDAEKRSIYKKNKELRDKHFKKFSDYINRVIVGSERFSFINILSDCANNGLMFSDLVNNYLKSEDLKDIDIPDEELDNEVEVQKAIRKIQCENVIKIVAMYKIFITARNANKRLNIGDISNFYNHLKEKLNVNIFIGDNLFTMEDEDKKVSLEQNFDVNFNKAIKPISEYLASDVLDTSQKMNYIDYFIVKDPNNNNNKKIIDPSFNILANILKKLDGYLTETKNEKIKISKTDIQKLVAKILMSINKGDNNDYLSKSKNKIDYIIDRVNAINRAYNVAINDNDFAKQTTMLNLIGKISLSINELSIDEMFNILNTIGDNLTNDFDILNKFDYIKEHKKENVIYSEVTYLYSIDPDKKYLNSGFSHSDLLSSVNYRVKQKKAKKKSIDNLIILKNDIIKKVEKEITKNNGTVGSDNKLIKGVSRNLQKVIKTYESLIENNNKETSVDEILTQLNKDYTNSWLITSANLARTENLTLLDELLKPGNTGGYTDSNFKTNDVKAAKQVVEYIGNLTQIFLHKKKEAKDLFKKLFKKALKQDISVEEKIQLSALYCMLHIRDQNKALHVEQISAIALGLFILLQNPNTKFATSRTFKQLGTGVGKTLTSGFQAFTLTLLGYTPVYLTSNQLLVNETMGEFEKNSIFKGHLYYLNEKQELINKKTQQKVELSEILDVLKDKRNIICSTYSGFDFWRKSLLLNGGENGIKIAKLLAEEAGLCIDEADSLIDPSTSNKMSVEGSGAKGIIRLKQAEAVQELYEFCNENKLKFTVKDQLDINIEDSKKQKLKEIIEKIAKLFKEDGNSSIEVAENGNGLSYLTNYSDIEYENILKFLDACSVANNYEINKNYTVETKEDGSNIYYILSGGVPCKDGSKYSTYVDLALKVSLKSKRGCKFNDLTKMNNVISESHNINIVDDVKTVVNLSGTIGASEKIWGQKGFSMDNIQSTYPKKLNAKQINNSITDTKHGYKNPMLDFIYFVIAIKDTFDAGDNPEEIKDFIVSVFNEYKNTGVYDDCCEEVQQILATEMNNDNHLKQIINKIILNNQFNDYHLTIMDNSNEIEAFSGRLNQYFEIAKQKWSTLDKEYDLLIPEIIKLDKRTNLLDDKSVKDKLASADVRNGKTYFVFGLPDRARGFDFPKSPNLIATCVTTDELNKQILGRTARNDRIGYINYAYAITDTDYKKYADKEKTVKQNLDNKSIQKIMDEKSIQVVNDFSCKNDYYELVNAGSDRILVFLNLLTRSCKDKSEDVCNEANEIVGDFFEKTREKFDSVYKKYKTEYLEPTGKFDRKKWEQLLEPYIKDFWKDLNDKVYPAIYNCGYYPAGEIKPDLNNLIKYTENTCKKITTRREKINTEDKAYKPKTITAKERYDKVQNSLNNFGIAIENEQKGDDEKYDFLENFKFQCNLNQEIFHTYESNAISYCNILGSLDGCDYKNFYPCELLIDGVVDLSSPSLTDEHGGNIYISKPSIVIAEKKVLDTSVPDDLNIKNRTIVAVNCNTISNDAYDSFINQLFNDDSGFKDRISALPEDAIITIQSRKGHSVFISVREFLALDDVNQVFSLCDSADSEFESFLNFFENIIDEEDRSNISYTNNEITNLALMISNIYTSEKIKFYTQNGYLPNSEDIRKIFENKYKSSFNRDFETIGEGDTSFETIENHDENAKKENQKYTKKVFQSFKTEVVANIKNSFRLGAREKFLEYLANEEQKIKPNVAPVIRLDELKEKGEDAIDELDGYKKYSFDFTDEEMEEIKKNISEGKANDVRYFSDIIIEKLRNYVNGVNSSISRIEKDRNLLTEDKRYLLEEYRKLISDKNLSLQAQKVMQIVETFARVELVSLSGDSNKVLDNAELYIPKESFEKQNWRDDINLDNIDDVGLKFSEMISAKQEGKNVADVIRECNNDQKNIKKLLTLVNNRAVDNFNTIQDNIVEVKKIRNCIDDVISKGNNIHFKGFKKEEDVSFIRQYLNDFSDNYENSLNNIKNNDVFSEKQKENFMNVLIDKSLDSAIKTMFTHDNIVAFFNEYSLTNDNVLNETNDPLYGMTHTSDDERKMFNEMINLYYSYFKDIKKADGGQGIEIDTEENEVNEEDEELEEGEEKPLTPEERFKNIIDNFRSDIKKIILKYQADIAPDSDSKSVNDKLPSRVCGFFKNVINALSENYKRNSEERENSIKDITESIKLVTSNFKGVKGYHEDFKKGIFKVFKEGLGELMPDGITPGNITRDESLKKIGDKLKEVDIRTMKIIKEVIGNNVSKHIEESEKRTKQAIEEKQELSTGQKFALLLLTFFTILATERGRKIYFGSKNKKNDDDVHVKKGIDLEIKDAFKKTGRSRNQRLINNQLSDVKIGKIKKKEISNKQAKLSTGDSYSREKENKVPN